MTKRLTSTRCLAILLLLSLGANLFLGGLAVGWSIGEEEQSSRTRRSVLAMLARLPERPRDIVRKEIGEALPQVQKQFAALKKARANLAEEMRKSKLDNIALERGFDAIRLHTMAIKAEFQQAIMRALPALSQEERRALVEALARREQRSALP